jgi:hypothetical protein
MRTVTQGHSTFHRTSMFLGDIDRESNDHIQYWLVSLSAVNDDWNSHQRRFQAQQTKIIS